ncbi:oligosaccharide flippase family protein [Solimicrobium silvestre]|nr:oligosaccharide flippase family protein [Solimicrobium silvestre]
MNSTRKSIGINFVTQYLELTIQFAGVLILARILTPADTGLYSVAAFLMTLLHVFRDFGVVNYIIQEAELTKEKIRSAYGVAIILALLVAGAMYACSTLVAGFYKNPAIKDILEVMALSFAVSPFGSLLFGIYRREMQFKRIFFIKIASAICHVAVATILATRGFGALSLAWANFAGILSFGIASNIGRPKDIPWLPQFTNIGKVLSFGSISSLGNAANAIGTNSPDLVIAKVIDMASVGYFSRGNGLVQLFAKLIASALTPLILPYFSQIKRSGTDLREPYLLSVNYLTTLAWPFFSVMALLALPMVRVLYGPQWDASVPIVQMLCIAGAISSLSIFAGHVMIANGQVQHATFAQLLSQPLRVIAVIYASSFGLFGISIAIIAAELLTLMIVSRYLRMTIRINFIELLHACRHSGLITIFSAAGPLLIYLFWPAASGSSWQPLVLGAVTATVGWLLGVILTKHPFFAQITEFLTSIQPPSPSSFKGQQNVTKQFKTAVKILSYKLGILSIYHRFRNKERLTVAMFHRVLPHHDQRRPGADPEWTMDTATFKKCLQFFQRHYHVISMDELAAALHDQKKLPPRSLLITFDDGWADTAEYAQPILDELGMASVVFVAGSVINQAAPFWQEAVYRLLATHPDGITQLNAALIQSSIDVVLVGKERSSEAEIRSVIQQLDTHNPNNLRHLATILQDRANAPAAMLSLIQLHKLAKARHYIGSHGMTHQPLTKVASAESEVKLAQETLSKHLNGLYIESMSFPHGAYDNSVLQVCREAHYRYLFSSDPILNIVNQQSPDNLVFGRIHISERSITDTLNKFHPFMLAYWLFLRPVRLGYVARSNYAE